MNHSSLSLILPLSPTGLHCSRGTLWQCFRRKSAREEVVPIFLAFPQQLAETDASDPLPFIAFRDRLRIITPNWWVVIYSIF